MDVFLNFEQLNELKLTDDKLGEIFLTKFKPMLSSIGRRRKEIKSPGMSYDVPSVDLFDQAKDLYYLGYFISAIFVCRSAAEYLAFEIFLEEVELEGKTEIIESVAESLDFRKIVTGFLYNPKKKFYIIDEKTHNLFNELYDIGNKWIHPKKLTKKVNIENESRKSIEILGSLIFSLRDVLKDYDIHNGGLIKKSTARKKIRPIVLGYRGK